MLKCADLTLYSTKVDGRGVYRLFLAAMDAAMQARRVLELDRRQALHTGQLGVFYQPLIDVRARRVASCKALLRWRHPTKGLVPPDQFIYLAEQAAPANGARDPRTGYAVGAAASRPAEALARESVRAGVVSRPIFRHQSR